VMSIPRPNYYLTQISTVLEYIASHLADDLNLNALAQVAGFSPFHFHRIFKMTMNENLNAYIVRRRLERAAALLKAAPTTPITRIALECGFQSSSDFSRTFKQHFSLSPGRWDRVSPLVDKFSKNCQDAPSLPHYDMDVLSEFERNFTIEIRDLPASTLAYIHITNSYSGLRVVQGYQRLMAWAERCLSGEAAQLVGMSQDDPDITPPAQCSYDIGLLLDHPVTGEGEVQVRAFPACRVAAVHAVGDINTVDQALQYLCRYWLPRSAYVPDNLPVMELYRRTPQEIGWQTFDLDCCIPITSL
jgi:AraC family transcriptional regulator